MNTRLWLCGIGVASTLVFALVGCASEPGTCKNASSKSCWSYPEDQATAFERDWRRCRRDARNRARGDLILFERRLEICLGNRGYVYGPADAEDPPAADTE
ncbi:MAG: hypothetical protein AAF430_20910 [Myxococcota bacterium]